MGLSIGVGLSTGDAAFEELEFDLEGGWIDTKDGLTGKGLMNGRFRCDDGFPPTESSLSLERPCKVGN